MGRLACPQRKWLPNATQSSAAPASSSVLRPLVMAKDIVLRSIAAIVCEERISRGRVQSVNRALAPLVFQHHHRRIAAAEQAKYPGRTLLGIVQDDRRSLAFSGRIESQHHAVFAGRVKEKQSGPP